MKKLRILYWVHNEEHKRCVAAFKKDNRIKQAILLSPTVLVGNTKFSLKVICSTFESCVQYFCPNIVVVFGTQPIAFDLVQRQNIKLVYMHHGIWAPTPRNIGKIGDDAWKQHWSKFDMFVCGRQKFVEEYSKHYDAEYVTNAVGQFDYLFEMSKIAKKLHIKYSPKQLPIITLFGHKNTGRQDVNMFNEDFYRAAVGLGEWAKRRSWKVFIKPKRENSVAFIRDAKNTHDAKWANELYKGYLALQKNPFVEFVPNLREGYSYLAASDVVMCTARSTIEIEAAMINKPLIKICRDSKYMPECDVHETLKYNAAYVFNRVKDIEQTIRQILYNGMDKKIINGQNNFIRSMGLACDGKAQSRLIEALINTWNTKWKI